MTVLSNRHNNHFKVSAESFGLNVATHKRFGPAITSLSDDTINVIKTELKPDVQLFELYRKQFNEQKKKKEPKDKKIVPIMVSTEVKQLVSEAAEKLGCDMKNLNEVAIKYYLHILETKPKSIPKEFLVTPNEKKSKS